MFRDGFFHADLHPGNMFVEPGGAIAVVDFGIMGRLDRKTRFFLADMLVGFLTGDYRRVAEVHFAAGYVPPHRSVDDFAQAARSIGEPILGKPLAEISIARLLAQLFRVTEQFEMETQPQLLLLQKTMVLVEGVGRQLDPTVNIWAMARPLIEEWMQDNRGPEAQLRQRVEDARRGARRHSAAGKGARHAGEDLVGRGCRAARGDPCRACRAALVGGVLGHRPALADRGGPSRNRRRAFTRPVAYLDDVGWRRQCLKAGAYC